MKTKATARSRFPLVLFPIPACKYTVSVGLTTQTDVHHVQMARSSKANSRARFSPVSGVDPGPSCRDAVS